ncbi:hypothetical protein FQR65_LT09939 [Abscondita terminalis]|nr:hypothetical protein FQR65_LT09939 [Abscondita terminalis]
MYRRAVTKELEEIARIELNETPQARREILQHIEEWLKKRPHININTEGFWLLNFIRGCKFSPQKTKEKLEAYFKVKYVIPEILSHRDPLLPALQSLLKNGYLRLGFSTCNLLFDHFSFIIPFGTPDKNVMKLAMMFFELFLNGSDTCMVFGHYAIVDFKGFSMAFMSQFSPILIKRFLADVLVAYPLRIKRLYFINCVIGVETSYNVCKYLFNTKIQKRISFYGNNYNSIFETIPKKYFPNEYGGCGGSLAELTDVWKNTMESSRQWFLENESYELDKKTNESVLSDEIGDRGTEGSFRKLDFD